MIIRLGVKTETLSETRLDPCDDWSQWSSSHNFSIECVTGDESKEENPDLEYEKFGISKPLNNAVYALVVRYSNGDSYGSASGKGEIVWVYGSEDMAKQAHAAYMRAVDNDDCMATIPAIDANGQETEVSIGNVISGYFCDLESLDIEEHTIS